MVPPSDRPPGLLKDQHLARITWWTWVPNRELPANGGAAFRSFASGSRAALKRCNYDAWLALDVIKRSEGLDTKLDLAMELG